MRRLASLAPAVLATLALSSCGLVDDQKKPTSTPASTPTTSSTPAPSSSANASDATASQPGLTKNQQDIRATVAAWIDSKRRGNKLAYCGLETKRLLHEQTGQTNAGVQITACVKGFKRRRDLPKPAELMFKSITSAGNAGVARFTLKSGERVTTKVKRSGGRWKVDDIRG